VSQTVPRILRSHPRAQQLTTLCARSWGNRSRRGTCTCRRQLCGMCWLHGGFLSAEVGRYCTTHLAKAEEDLWCYNRFVRVYAATWALRATHLACVPRRTKTWEAWYFTDFISMISSSLSSVLRTLCCACQHECNGVCQHGQHNPPDMWSVRDSEGEILPTAGG